MCDGQTGESYAEGRTQNRPPQTCHLQRLLQREVSLQIKETILKLGLVFLMMVVVFVIYNDISRILTRS